MLFFLFSLSRLQKVESAVLATQQNAQVLRSENVPEGYDFSAGHAYIVICLHVGIHRDIRRARRSLSETREIFFIS